MNTIDRKLQCEVRSVHYDNVKRCGMVIMAPVTCVDMTGYVELFESLDPEVLEIRTYEQVEDDSEETVADTWYRRKSVDRAWKAYDP